MEQLFFNKLANLELSIFSCIHRTTQYICVSISYSTWLHKLLMC